MERGPYWELALSAQEGLVLADRFLGYSQGPGFWIYKEHMRVSTVQQGAGLSTAKETGCEQMEGRKSNFRWQGDPAVSLNFYIFLCWCHILGILLFRRRLG